MIRMITNNSTRMTRMELTKIAKAFIRIIRSHSYPFVSGFTLIETLVAIAVLLTAIAGPLTIASKGLSSAALARDQISASALAQEAIEYVRWKRDTNQLAGQAWLAGLDTCTAPNSCILDATKLDSTAFTTCVGICSALRYNTTSGFFTYSASDQLPAFTRTIQLTSLGTDEVRITVSVSWESPTGVHTLTVREGMLNWQ